MAEVINAEGNDNGKQTIIRLSGYLEKKVKLGFIQCWKKLWCVLEGQLLLYYKSYVEYLKLSPCRGSLNMALVLCVQSHQPRRIRIYTHSQFVILRAKNKSNQQEWLQALLEAMPQSTRMAFNYFTVDFPSCTITKKKPNVGKSVRRNNNNNNNNNNNSKSKSRSAELAILFENDNYRDNRTFIEEDNDASMETDVVNSIIIESECRANDIFRSVNSSVSSTMPSKDNEINGEDTDEDVVDNEEVIVDAEEDVLAVIDGCEVTDNDDEDIIEDISNDDIDVINRNIFSNGIVRLFHDHDVLSKISETNEDNDDDDEEDYRSKDNVIVGTRREEKMIIPYLLEERRVILLKDTPPDDQTYNYDLDSFVNEIVPLENTFRDGVSNNNNNNINDNNNIAAESIDRGLSRDYNKPLERFSSGIITETDNNQTDAINYRERNDDRDKSYGESKPPEEEKDDTVEKYDDDTPKNHSPIIRTNNNNNNNNDNDNRNESTNDNNGFSRSKRRRYCKLLRRRLLLLRFNKRPFKFLKKFFPSIRRKSRTRPKRRVHDSREFSEVESKTNTQIIVPQYSDKSRNLAKIEINATVHTNPESSDIEQTERTSFISNNIIDETAESYPNEKSNGSSTPDNDDKDSVSIVGIVENECVLSSLLAENPEIREFFANDKIYSPPTNSEGDFRKQSSTKQSDISKNFFDIDNNYVLTYSDNSNRNLTLNHVSGQVNNVCISNNNSRFLEDDNYNRQIDDNNRYGRYAPEIYNRDAEDEQREKIADSLTDDSTSQDYSRPFRGKGNDRNRPNSSRRNTDEDYSADINTYLGNQSDLENTLSRLTTTNDESVYNRCVTESDKMYCSGCQHKTPTIPVKQNRRMTSESKTSSYNSTFNLDMLLWQLLIINKNKPEEVQTEYDYDIPRSHSSLLEVINKRRELDVISEHSTENTCSVLENFESDTRLHNSDSFRITPDSLEHPWILSNKGNKIILNDRWNDEHDSDEDVNYPDSLDSAFRC